jgi:hypothetical protein
MLAEATGAEPAEMCVAAQQRDRAHGGGLAFRGGKWGPRRQARGCGWAAAVEHRGERPGAPRVTCSPVEPLTPAGDRLVRNVTAQAGPVLRNVGLI